MEIVVRDGREDDLDAIRVFAADTFDWGDYVADAYLEWLSDDEGQVFVVEADDEVAGVARVVLLSPRESWLHGARVHPDFRRAGIGVAMNSACVEWSRARGAVVARLMTEDDNTAALNQVRKLDYRPVARFMYCTAGETEKARTSSNGGRRAGQRMSPARQADAGVAWAAWSAGDFARQAHGLIPIGWQWRSASLDDIRAAARRRELLGGPPGWALASSDDETLHVYWITCGEDQGNAMLDGLTSVARQQQLRLTLQMPRVEWLVQKLDDRGFEVSPSTVFARQIA